MADVVEKANMTWKFSLVLRSPTEAFFLQFASPDTLVQCVEVCVPVPFLKQIPGWLQTDYRQT